jgi:arylsulfatase B
VQYCLDVVGDTLAALPSARGVAAFIALACASACVPPGEPNSPAQPPHIVLIVADDLGWGDVGYHASPIRTPSIDRIAAEGVELDRFYVQPLCSPTRAALVTGRYPIRFGLSRAVVAPWRDFGLDVEEATLPQILARAGYRHRALFGKWHLGHLRREWHPIERGFTHFYGHYNGAIDHFEHTRLGERDWHRDFEPVVESGYSTDLIADAASAYIRGHARQGPLFLMVSFSAVHPPFQAPEHQFARYAELGDAEGVPRLRQMRAAMISSMDDGIGRILAALDEARIAEDTLVWFLSDNGGVTADPLSNRPLRGGKYDLFEGGIRVPACLRWPRGLAPGTRVEDPTAVQDVMPTLMQVAGIADHGGRPLDGLGLLDLLRGSAPAQRRELYFHSERAETGDEELALLAWPWKLVLRCQDADLAPVDCVPALFDLSLDPLEAHDVSGGQAELVRQLAPRLRAFRELGPPRAIASHDEGRDTFLPPPAWRIASER